MTMRSTFTPLPAAEFNSAFPNSRKVYLDGPSGVRVPMREIALSGGEPSLRVYDSSGPQGVDVRGGLPQIRREWIIARGDVVEETRSLAELGSVDRPMPPALAERARTRLRKNVRDRCDARTDQGRTVAADHLHVDMIVPCIDERDDRRAAFAEEWRGKG